MTMRKPTTTISTLYHRHRSRLAGLAARSIDVNPGSGDVEFTFDLDLWERYRWGLEGPMHQCDDAWVILEIYLWQKAIRYPIAWMMLMQSSNLAFMDHYNRFSQTNPRVVTAVLIHRILNRMGYSTELGFEYSPPPEK